MNEIWKNIKDYEGIYQCSNTGKIRTCDRIVTESNGKTQFRRGQEIKPHLNKNGYLQFALNKNAKRKMVYVHIIVAQTFLNNPNNLKTVNHKDGNKTNNNIDNLEWCSYSDNNKHSYSILNRSVVDEGASPKPIYVINTESNIISYYPSITAATYGIGLSHTQINRYVHSRKKWKGKYIITTDSNKCVEDIEKVS